MQDSRGEKRDRRIRKNRREKELEDRALFRGAMLPLLDWRGVHRFCVAPGDVDRPLFLPNLSGEASA